MRLRLVLCVAALLAACSPESEAPSEEADAGAGVAAKRMPLPDCATVETQDLGADGWRHPDCRLMLSDNSGLAVEARYKKAEDESTMVSAQVVAPGDATLQTIEETMGNTFNQISVQDIDKDGKADLLLPLETGNVNTTWAVWLQHNDTTPAFGRAGELSGVSIGHTADGYLAVPARSSADSWSVEFWRLDGGILFPLATAEVSASLDDKGEPSDVKCAVLYDGQTAGIGLSPQEAEKKFCAEPSVAEIFK